jgi:hypothetical protein
MGERPRVGYPLVSVTSLQLEGSALASRRAIYAAILRLSATKYCSTSRCRVIAGQEQHGPTSTPWATLPRGGIPRPGTLSDLRLEMSGDLDPERGNTKILKVP